MKSFISFKEPIGRSLFAILYVLSMFVYGGAFYFIQEANIFLLLVRIFLVFVSLSIYISILMRRLIDIGKKRSDIYLLFIPIYNIYVLFLLFTKKGNK